MIARVFPRRTRAAPTDEFAFYGPPGLFPPEVDEVHVSVAFTWDLGLADYLAESWKSIGPVKIGGPALRQSAGAFIPGQYLKKGYVITSRGCPNRCWFCDVWKVQSGLMELEIKDGWNVLDDNLLACSEKHIRAVFEMLARQPEPIEFTGGFEAARLQDWHIDLLLKIRLKQVFFAYDTPEDLEQLRAAGKKLLNAGFTRRSHRLRAYVLIGYSGDTFEKAEERLQQTAKAGFLPMAMLWRNRNGNREPKWRTFQRHWARPASVYAQIRR